MECLPPGHLCHHGSRWRVARRPVQQPEHQFDQVPHEVLGKETAQQDMEVRKRRAKD